VEELLIPTTGIGGFDKVLFKVGAAEDDTVPDVAVVAILDLRELIPTAVMLPKEGLPTDCISFIWMATPDVV
jgi:hypothetical protein